MNEDVLKKAIVESISLPTIWSKFARDLAIIAFILGVLGGIAFIHNDNTTAGVLAIVIGIVGYLNFLVLSEFLEK